MFPECSEHNEYVIIYIRNDSSLPNIWMRIHAPDLGQPLSRWTHQSDDEGRRRKKHTKTKKHKQQKKRNRTNRVYNSEPSQMKFVHKENGIIQNTTLEQCSHIESVMPADRAYNVHAEHQTKGIEKYKIDVTFFDSPLVYSSVLRLFFV